jgi:hypothetical protein
MTNSGIVSTRLQNGPHLFLRHFLDRFSPARYFLFFLNEPQAFSRSPANMEIFTFLIQEFDNIG